MDKTLNRIQSIDVLRGLIMVIMALDHTRDYFHTGGMSGDPTNMETTTPFLFFTRWITHYCAPLFVFLSGTSIYLQSRRKTKKELSLFLFTRGLWLVIAEFTIVSFGWSFDIDFDFFFLQVIWAIGMSMVVLSGLIFLNYKYLLAIGIIITLCHNILDKQTFTDPALDFAANMLLITEFDTFPIGGLKIMFAYAILPWTGIMLLGYALGKWYTAEIPAPFRRKALLISGSTIILLFITLRWINLYGDPKPWEVQRNFTYTILSFLNVTKYPPSLLYACMTIGPGLIMLAFIEKLSNRLTWMLNVLGRVPFFYYILHIYIIHILCIGLYFAQGFTIDDLKTKKMSFALFVPDENFGLSLPYVYLIWLLVIILCYYPGKWYNRYKTTHKSWWLSYL
jgi:uncharacterized membrane protein